MATTGPPFDKPMDELREAFVRARFAQEDVFGLPGIEAWLDEQRRRSSPYHDSDHEHYERWLSRLLGRAMMSLDPDRLLSQGATAHDASTLNNRLSGPFLHTKHHFRPLLTGLTTLHGREGRTTAVFLGHVRGAIIAVSDDHGEPRSFVIREAPGRTPSDSPSGSLIIDPLTSPQQAMEYVVDVLYAEWMDQLPKWRKARKFLCDAIAEEIKRERAKAEHDFDTAVAVSADGTKIVHADWIIIRKLREPSRPNDRTQRCARKTEWVRVFRGEQFRGARILRAHDMKHGKYSSAMEASTTLNERIRLVLFGLKRTFSEHYRSAQLFGRVDERSFFTGEKLPRGTTESFLFTTADFCPSLLPDGGVEVTV